MLMALGALDSGRNEGFGESKGTPPRSRGDTEQQLGRVTKPIPPEGIMAHDDYGFEWMCEDTFEAEEVLRYQERGRLLMQEQQPTWSALMRDPGFPAAIKGTREFKQLVRQGIPRQYRPRVWHMLSGAGDLHIPGMYQRCLDQEAARILSRRPSSVRGDRVERGDRSRSTSMSRSKTMPYAPREGQPPSRPTSAGPKAEEELQRVIHHYISILDGDLWRTFPNNTFFARDPRWSSGQSLNETGDYVNPYITCLRNVLVAFVHYSMR
jgi:hypothetical protein